MTQLTRKFFTQGTEGRPSCRIRSPILTLDAHFPKFPSAPMPLSSRWTHGAQWGCQWPLHKATNDAQGREL